MTSGFGPLRYGKCSVGIVMRVFAGEAMNNAIVNVHLAVCHPFVGLATVFRGTCTCMCTVVHVYLYM